jgi:TATA-box binding protein (TBP) (component of TFIID and TFIIIB)
MKDLQIEPTNTTPLVEFYESGKLILAGSVYPENAKEFFEPIIEWIEEFQNEEVDFDLIIEYINTSSAKKLLELLQKLDSSKYILSRKVNWFYQKWDEDSLETGQILSDSLPGITFNFVEYEKNK